MKSLALLLLSVVVGAAQLNLFNAAYPPLLRSIPTTIILDSPTNYATLGVWHLAEDATTNNGSLKSGPWTNRAVPTFYVLGGTDCRYSNAIGAVPHLLAFNQLGPITSGASGYTNKAGVPTGGNGFTYILFGRCNTNPNNAPLLWKADTTEQFRLGIAATNEIGVFQNVAGTFTIGVSNALTNAGYRVIGFVYSNTQARAYQNMVMGTLNTLGVNVSMNTLENFVANVDVVEFMVWTNNALNVTQYGNLYTNYFKAKYTNANL